MSICSIEEEEKEKEEEEDEGREAATCAADGDGSAGTPWWLVRGTLSPPPHAVSPALFPPTKNFPRGRS